jgi:ribosomal protein S18 acetylase RimI-like enzyme
MLEVTPATTESQCQQVRKLMAEYADWDVLQFKRLGFDVEELLRFYGSPKDEALPGPFAPPHGGVYLATYFGRSAGCGAFRRLDRDACEMKRVFVRPEFRRLKIGRELVRSLIAAARERGYRIMRLETNTLLLEALELYLSLGFRQRDPYYVIPPSFRGTAVFMEFDLGDRASGSCDLDGHLRPPRIGDAQ